MFVYLTRKLLGVLAFIVCCTLSVLAQDEWKWPEHPKNLQVLDSTTTGQKLRSTMFGFTRALGVRCTYCHKGEDGKPFSTFDFASDEKSNKGRAREMMRMVNDIKGHLQKITPTGDKRVIMNCYTCHQGRPKPMTLAEELGERYRMQNLDSALQHYQRLKKNYYGRGAYDFSESSLNAFGYEVLQNDDTKGALRVFVLNTEEHPESGNTWDSLGEAYLKAGDSKRAQEAYEKSLALDPENDNAKEILKKIKDEGKK